MQITFRFNNDRTQDTTQETKCRGRGAKSHKNTATKRFVAQLQQNKQKKTINLYMPFYTEYSDVSLISRFYIHL